MRGHAKPRRDGQIQEKKRSILPILASFGSNGRICNLSSSVGLLPKDYDEIKLDSVIRRLTEYTVRARKDMSR